MPLTQRIPVSLALSAVDHGRTIWMTTSLKHTTPVSDSARKGEEPTAACMVLWHAPMEVVCGTVEHMAFEHSRSVKHSAFSKHTTNHTLARATIFLQPYL
jgi:hypothetical protein